MRVGGASHPARAPCWAGLPPPPILGTMRVSQGCLALGDGEGILAVWARWERRRERGGSRARTGGRGRGGAWDTLVDRAAPSFRSRILREEEEKGVIRLRAHGVQANTQFPPQQQQHWSLPSCWGSQCEFTSGFSSSLPSVFLPSFHQASLPAPSVADVQRGHPTGSWQRLTCSTHAGAHGADPRRGVVAKHRSAGTLSRGGPGRGQDPPKFGSIKLLRNPNSPEPGWHPPEP